MTGRSDRSAAVEVDDEVRAQFAAMNVSIRRKAKAAEERFFEVSEENWPTLLLFLALETQWRTQLSPRGRVIWFGLDYTAAESLMRIERMKNKASRMRDLRIMEAAALRVLNGGSPAEGDEPWL